MGPPPTQSLTPQYTTVPQHQLQQQLQPQPTAFAPPPSAPPSTAGAGAGGQTSSDIARSFTGAPAQSTASPSQSNRNAIPKQRLSFITASDQAKFEQLFRSAVGDGQALEGEFHISDVRVWHTYTCVTADELYLLLCYR